MSIDLQQALASLRAYLARHAGTRDEIVTEQLFHFAGPTAAYLTFGDLRALLAALETAGTANADLVKLARKAEEERHVAVLESNRWQERAELAELALRPQPMETAPRDQTLILVQMAADDWRGPPVRRVTAWWGGDAAGWCSVGHAGLQPICWWTLPPAAGERAP